MLYEAYVDVLLGWRCQGSSSYDDPPRHVLEMDAGFRVAEP